MIVAFLIWTLCALLFIACGIYCRNAKKAVGFFTFTQPPKVKDAKNYNKAVSNLWLACGVLFEIPGILFLFIHQNSPLAILIILPSVWICIGLLVGYSRILGKYSD